MNLNIIILEVNEWKLLVHSEYEMKLLILFLMKIMIKHSFEVYKALYEMK